MGWVPGREAHYFAETKEKIIELLQVEGADLTTTVVRRLTGDWVEEDSLPNVVLEE